MHTGTSALQAGIERVAALVERVGAVAFAVVTLLTFVSALLRYFLDYPIPDAFDVTRMLLGVMVFWGLASVAYRDSHIRVDLFWELAGPRLKRVMDLLASGLTAAALVLLCWHLYRKVGQIVASNEVTFDLRIQVWPFYVAIWIGSLAVAVMSVARFVLVALRRVATHTPGATAD